MFNLLIAALMVMAMLVLVHSYLVNRYLVSRRRSLLVAPWQPSRASRLTRQQPQEACLTV